MRKRIMLRTHFFLVSISVVGILLLPSQSPSQWAQLNGPYGGAVLSLRYANSKMYAGTTGGLWVSSDTGASWTQLSRGRTRQVGVFSSGTIIAGENPDHVFRSTDGGVSWAPVSLGNPSAILISINFLQGDVALAGATTGLFKSVNDGLTWSQITTGLPSGEVDAMAVDSSGRLFLTSGVDIYRSADTGASWNKVYHDPNNHSVRSIAATSLGSVFAAQYGGGVLRSTDGGVVWTLLNPTFSNTYQSICSTPSGAVVAGLDGGGMVRTTDNGTTWTDLLRPTYYQIMSLMSGAAGDIFVGSAGAGVFRSSDLGSTWSSISNGMAATSIASLCVIPGGTSVAARLGDVFRSTDNGLNWTNREIDVVDYNQSSVIRSDSGNYFFANSYGVYRSTDDALTWTSVSGSIGFDFYGLITTAEGAILAGSRYLYRSSDEGATWAMVLSDPVSTYDFARLRTGELFAGTAAGIYRSTNDGRSWQAFSDSFHTRYVASIVVYGDSTLYAGIGGQTGGIYRSTNHGSSWKLVFHDNASNPDYHLSINRNGDVYAAISRQDVRRSTDGGSTWSLMNDEISDREPLCIQIAKDHFAYVGTARGGVYRTVSWTLRPPDAPIGLRPSNDTVNAPLSVTLRWREQLAADTYHLQVSTDSLFASNIIVDDSALSVLYREVSNLIPGVRYFWRLNGTNEAGTGPFSEIWHFTTMPPPAIVTLVSPANGAMLPGDNVAVVWKKSFPAVTRYWVEYGSDSLFLNSVVDSAVVDTQQHLSGFGLDTTYWWKVRAYNASGWGGFSELRRFSPFTTGIDVRPAWNMVSVPRTVSDYRKTVLFPTASSSAFAYDTSGYGTADTLMNGKGYWVKFPSSNVVAITGSSRTTDTISVNADWNLVGTISVPVPATSILSIPDGILASGFFGYSTSYFTADTLKPGGAYWVKVSSPGKIILK
ncbi:MAG TPA: YCF48-related protein [Bacteroidota bacterium]|nr:YCF48-related protein [Bacteroidota bacterium]